MMRISSLAALLAAAFTVAACRSESVNPLQPDVQAVLGEITPAQWQRLTDKTIYFGHQSVGADILAGIQELAREHPQIRLTVIESGSPLSIGAPGLVHSAVGRNGEPQSKLAEFTAVLDSGAAEKVSVAMVKFCYLDVHASTNVPALFEDYRSTMRAMRTRYPKLTLVHITMPLTTVESWPRLLVKQVLGKPTSRDLNALRNQYNTLLRQEYQGEPLFDLAQLESTRPDGSRTFTEVRGKAVYTLAPEYTDDGGHLNREGRRVIAARLLALLASL